MFARRFRWIALVLALTAFGRIETASAAQGNDYPTEAIAEYVYGCLKANGETRPVLLACACSVDILSSLLTYERYVEAGTFLSMLQYRGEAADLFRNSPHSKASIQDLRRAQAEADVRCFKFGG